MLLIFWVITPLQSGIFTTGTREVPHNVPVVAEAHLIPFAEQASALDNSFMIKAHGVLWLGTKLSNFTTSQYALQPFELPQFGPDLNINATWTAPTVSYWTELSCTPASEELKDGTYTFSDGNGCTVSNMGLETEMNHTIMEYIGWYDSISSDFALSQSQETCPQASSHKFLSIWANSSMVNGQPTPSNIASMFCTPSYYSQEVNATVILPDLEVQSISSLGPRTILSDDLFNSSAFEFMLATGVPPVTTNKDFPNVFPPQEEMRLANESLMAPITNMVGFALGNSSISVEDYSKPALMHTGYEAAHALLFALAINQMMMPQGVTAGESAGSINVQVNAIVVVRVFALLVEVGLGLVALCAIVLLAYTWGRVSNLGRDPASLADIMGYTTTENRLNALTNVGEATSSALEHILRGKRFRLVKTRDDGNRTSDVFLVEDHGSVHASTVQEGGRIAHKPRIVKPFELSLPAGAVMLLLLSSTSVLFAILYHRIQSDNGLPRPSENLVILQVLFNYLPTAFATILEPTWVVLNRLLCILQPFEALQSGKATSSKSLDLRYTSLPPQLIALRALVAKHFLLASVCVITLLANPLAVAFSSIFRDVVVPFERGVPFRNQFLPLLVSSDLTSETTSLGGDEQYMDHFYILQVNLSDNTPLPAWVAPGVFFQPFGPVESVAGANIIYQALTQGFGMDIQCKDISDDVHLNISADSTDIVASPDLSGDNQDIVNCLVHLKNNLDGTDVSSPNTNLSATPSALEFWDLGHCSGMIVGGWARANFTQASSSLNSSPSSLQLRDLSYMFLACRPILRNAQYLLTTDQAGRVLSYEQRTPTSNDMSAYIAQSINISSLYSNASSIFNSIATTPSWHTDAVASDYINYFLKLLSHSSAITDPSAPVPDFATTAAMVTDVNSRLFAILLGLNYNSLFQRAPANQTIPGTVFVNTHRIFMNITMFIIIEIILALNIIVACVLYSPLSRQNYALPRMPTSIASVVAYVANSQIVEEMRDRKREDQRAKQNQPKLEKSSRKEKTEEKSYYGFGKFVGVDGKPHVGIERWPFVIPLRRRRFRDRGADSEPEEGLS